MKTIQVISLREHLYDKQMRPAGAEYPCEESDVEVQVLAGAIRVQEPEARSQEPGRKKKGKYDTREMVAE